MSELLYETRGSSDLQNQIRIYYAAAPHDFKDHYKWTRDVLFQAADCAVFYHDPDQPPQDVRQLETDLSKMKIIVMIITQELLESDSVLLNTCLQCAQTYHLPILPLLYTGASEELYRKKFGTIQYIDNRRGTSGSPGNKLQSFLGAYIVEPEMIERIRGNFKATVFISYRRRDQSWITDLKRWIYEDPELEGVACWYDEFLTPGEDFNGTIMNALSRSDIFLMMLTDSMLEKGNYVITTEYPAAIRLKKEIVSVALEAMDPKMIESAYDKNAADPIDINTEGLTTLHSSGSGYMPPTAVLERVKAGALKLRQRLKELLADKLSREEGAEYCYLLGLAYLYGVDVNRDAEKAELILTRAAAKGYFPAILKLSGLNSEWYGKLSEQYLERYRTDPTRENAFLYMDALFRYANYRRTNVIEPPSVKLERYRRLIAFAESFSGDEDADRMRFDSYLAMADVYREDDLPKDCDQKCRELLPLFEEQAKDGSSESAARLGMLNWLLGDSAIENNNRSSADTYYSRGNDALSGVPDNSTSYTVRFCRSRLMSLKAKSELSVFRFRQARKSIEQALGIAKELDEGTPDPDLQRHLYDCLSISADLRHFAEDTSYYDASRETLKPWDYRIRKPHIEKRHAYLRDNSPDRFLYRYSLDSVRDEACSGGSVRLLLDSCNRIINACVSSNNPAPTPEKTEFSEYIARAVEIAALLLNKTIPTDGGSGFDLVAHLEHPEGFISTKRGFDRLPVLEYLAGINRFWYTQIDAHCRFIYAANGSPAMAAKMLTAATEGARYRALYEIAAPDKQREMFEQLLNTAEKLRKVCPAEAEACMFEAQLELARCDFNVCNLSQAASACRKMLKKQCDVKGLSERIVLGRKVRVLTLLGEIAFRQKKYDKASDWLDQAYDIDYNNAFLWMQNLTASCGSRILMRFADISRANGSCLSAANQDEKALEHARAMTNGWMHRTPEKRLTLADCYLRLAAYSERTRDKLDYLNSAHLILKNDNTVPARMRKTLLIGLRALTYHCATPASVLSQWSISGSKYFFEKKFILMIKEAQKLVEETDSSPEAMKLFFDALVLTERYYMSDTIHNEDRAREFKSKWVPIGSQLYMKYRGLLTDEEIKMICSTILRTKGMKKLLDSAY